MRLADAQAERPIGWRLRRYAAQRPASVALGEPSSATAIATATGRPGLARLSWLDGGRPTPKLRHGNYFPGFLEPRRMAEKALTTVIQEPYI